MKKILLGFLLAFIGASPLLCAAESKPVYKWISANEYYLILPAAQNLHLTESGDTENVKPWGFGIRAVGNEKFSKSGGLQLQSIKVDNPGTGKNTFYLLELLLGMEYRTPLVRGKPLRYTTSAFADLGLADTTLYAAPVIFRRLALHHR